ncbi:hypothetical protein R6Q57_023034 [Mikania cordata]
MNAAGSGSNGSQVETPLLDDVVDGFVDYKNRPVFRSRSGCWRSAYFIIGVEIAERFAYYGVSSNLIMYLTGPLGQSTATAAENVNAWAGAVSLLPLFGAFVADAFLGRYRTIVIASSIYIMALGLLTVSALIPNANCETATSCSPPQFQVILFFISLYLLAFAQGGHKPCVQAFGADQFDSENPEECKAKSSFFNWWYLGLCGGPLIALGVLNYIQDNISWALGFGIPLVVMGLALLIFLAGTATYRFGEKTDEKSAFIRIGQVFVRAFKNWKTTPSISMEEEASGTLPHQGSQQFRFLNRALISPDGSKEEGRVSSPNEVEEAKAVLRLAPIWASCLVFAVVFAQFSTLFTKQGVTMDRSIGPNFEVPAATLQSFISLTVVILIPIYDQILVPIARSVTRKPSGITMLQRIGTGIFISVISMVVSALVEIKRLQTADKYGLVDDPNAVIPMKIWWLLPQYLLTGAADVFTMVGLQEFFYDQVPSEMRSIGLALYLSIFGVGSFLSSFLISVVEKTTGGADGEDGWISDNLNRGHLDYFYWLLAGISAIAFLIYLYFAKSYVYNRASTI